MIVRTDWRMRRPLPQLQTRPQKNRSLRNGRYLIGFLSGLLLVWMAYRFLVRPSWHAALHPLLVELLALMEAAAVITLLLLGALFWWRSYRPAAVPAVTPPSVDELYALSPAEFERYVAQLFRHKGYRVKLRGRKGDLGVDLELTQAGGKRAIVQCKRYQNTIGPDIVRELFGTLVHERAAHAFLVTTADISASAREWARGKPITLIDGQTLVDIVAALQGHNRP